MMKRQAASNHTQAPTIRTPTFLLELRQNGQTLQHFVHLRR
ncbi:hypothetical protein [Ktedonospora formicarum]|nr:hypothetical protein [Ktedonospora formicarum]